MRIAPRHGKPASRSRVIGALFASDVSQLVPRHDGSAATCRGRRKAGAIAAMRRSLPHGNNSAKPGLLRIASAWSMVCFSSRCRFPTRTG